MYRRTDSKYFQDHKEYCRLRGPVHTNVHTSSTCVSYLFQISKPDFISKALNTNDLLKFDKILLKLDLDSGYRFHCGQGSASSTPQAPEDNRISGTLDFSSSFSASFRIPESPELNHKAPLQRDKLRRRSL